MSGNELELPISYMTCSHTSACLCAPFQYAPQYNLKSKCVLNYQGHLHTVKTAYAKSIDAKGLQHKCKPLINFTEYIKSNYYQNVKQENPSKGRVAKNITRNCQIFKADLEASFAPSWVLI